MLKKYYRLTKPGIVYGNDLAAVAGFIFGSGRRIDLSVFSAMLAGLSLIIGAACVFNNYLDRDIDQLMERTKKRALTAGDIAPTNALIFATILLILGCVLLGFGTNRLALSAGLFGFAAYVFLYGWAKRATTWSTVIGSISGAVPPVVGYAAAVGKLDLNALFLFLILVFWQMPHFYAIGIYRRDDYVAAGLPILPVRRGFARTRRSIFIYMGALILSLIGISVFGRGGKLFAIVTASSVIIWMTLGYANIKKMAEKKWARKIFFQSLHILLIICLMLSLNAWLP